MGGLLRPSEPAEYALSMNSNDENALYEAALAVATGQAEHVSDGEGVGAAGLADDGAVLTEVWIDAMVDSACLCAEQDRSAKLTERIESSLQASAFGGHARLAHLCWQPAASARNDSRCSDPTCGSVLPTTPSVASVSNHSQRCVRLPGGTQSIRSRPATDSVASAVLLTG